MRLFSTLFLLLLSVRLFAADPQTPHLRVGIDRTITIYAGYTLVASDATPAYEEPRNIDTGLPLTTWMYPGLYDHFAALDPKYKGKSAKLLMVGDLHYNPMRYVIRTVLFVRGPRLYVLIVDNDDKDGNLGSGLTNTIRFDRTGPDHRTRLTWHQGGSH